MRILSPEEVKSLLATGKLLPDSMIKAILNELERCHPAIYRFIYGEPSDLIAAINKDMSNLYLDLAFDVVWIFREAFGGPPVMANADAWVFTELEMSPAEVKVMAEEMEIEGKMRMMPQGCLARPGDRRRTQSAILNYLETAAVAYASFQRGRASALHLTNHLLFILVLLIDDCYSEAKAKSA